jgi:hypothetical protein
VRVSELKTKVKKEASSSYKISSASGLHEQTIGPQVTFYNSNKSQGAHEDAEECEIAGGKLGSFWAVKQPSLSLPYPIQTPSPSCF